MEREGERERERDRDTEREGRERERGKKRGKEAEREEKLSCIWLVRQVFSLQDLISCQSAFTLLQISKIYFETQKRALNCFFVVTIPLHFSGNHLRAVYIESPLSCLKWGGIAGNTL